jgi:hypothetical protein
MGALIAPIGAAYSSDRRAVEASIGNGGGLWRGIPPTLAPGKEEAVSDAWSAVILSMSGGAHQPTEPPLLQRSISRRL